ncbi:hypothetical protein SAMD00019534_077970, partial [Acytostelium subglobosum LB1]|uniref:hypothetical protein n=1 Tax=Acytostelium subglobosum LB1 TaxID=1410327 RepID=UPI000644A778
MMMQSGMIDSLHEENVEVDQLPLMIPIIDDYEPRSNKCTPNSTPMTSHNHIRSPLKRHLSQKSDDFLLAIGNLEGLHSSGDHFEEHQHQSHDQQQLNQSGGGHGQTQDSDDEQVIFDTGDEDQTTHVSYISHLSTPPPPSETTPPAFQTTRSGSGSLEYDNMDMDTMLANSGNNGNRHFPRFYYRHSIMDPVSRPLSDGSGGNMSPMDEKEAMAMAMADHALTKAQKYNTTTGYIEGKHRKHDHYRDDYFEFVAPPPTTPHKPTRIIDDFLSDFTNDGAEGDEDEDELVYERIRASGGGSRQESASSSRHASHKSISSLSNSHNNGSSVYNSNSNINNNGSIGNMSGGGSGGSVNGSKKYNSGNNKQEQAPPFDYRNGRDFQLLLDRIKDNSMYCGTQFAGLMAKVKLINNSMNHIMSKHFELYAKTSNDVLDESFQCMAMMQSLINSMELLNSDVFPMYKLASQIKHARKSLDLLELYVNRLPSDGSNANGNRNGKAG